MQSIKNHKKKQKMQTLTAAIQNDILAEMGVFKSDDVTIEEKSSFAVADLQEAKKQE